MNCLDLTFRSIPEQKNLIQIAKSNLPVLITGPSGSGKSTIARKIHDLSPRCDKPFVVVNLAEMHEGTLESVLFGHEKGAFTGAASRRTGLLNQADGGTLFLDEISELNIKYQARLLEVLQSSMIRTIGGNESKKLNIRVICATHRDLELMVIEKSFREDLLYRIRVLQIELLGLQNPEIDFDTVVHDMVDKAAFDQGKKILTLDEKFIECLESYRWPGNFRELQHLIEASVVQCGGNELAKDHLPNWFMKKINSQLPKNFTCDLTHLVKNFLHTYPSKKQIAFLNHSTVLYALKNGYFEWANDVSKDHKLPLPKVTGLSQSTLWRMKSRMKNELIKKDFEEF